MNRSVQDIRHAARQLCNRPGFLIVVVPSLSLGIGDDRTSFRALNACCVVPCPATIRKNW